MRTLILTCIIALGLAGSAFATQGGFVDSAPSVRHGGGFKGPGQELTTVERAKNLGDDSHVVMRGQIERNLGGEKYMFRDATGTIKVEIDNDLWNGQLVTPQDTVEIYGKVDKDFRQREIDVKRIVKISGQ